MPVAAIIAALIAAGTSAYAGYKQNQAAAAAGKEAKGLAEQQRSDILGQNALTRSDTLAAQAQQQKNFNKQFDFAKSEATKSRASDAYKTTYQMTQDKLQQAMQALSANTQLRDRALKLFGG